MHKNKPHKGALKRVRITRSGRIKIQHAFKSHLRSHKPASRIRRIRKPKYAAEVDLPRFRALLHLPARRRPTAASKRTEFGPAAPVEAAGAGPRDRHLPAPDAGT
jgi:large subunit ribosomal protein L35